MKKPRIKWGRAFGLPFLVLAMFSCRPPEAETGADPPAYNVLFIAVDDLRTELNCYGADHIQSPHIDRLAAAGVRFSKAYVQQAICMASRASLMSGIRPGRLGMYTGEPVSAIMPDVLTLNKFFQQNGYTVASTGKIYHYDEDTEEQFGADYLPPGGEWNGTKYAKAASIELARGNVNPDNGPAYERAEVGDDGYRDGINTTRAIRRLAELKQEGKPFFLSVGLRKPHLPFAAPGKYWDMYPESSVQLPELRHHPLNSGKQTMRTRGELTNYVGMPEAFAAIDDSTTLTLRRAYYACVSYADAQVGRLLDALETQGMRKNTIVVLWGDHGYKLGDYGNWCKWSNMNIDTRIPLIISAPGSSPGEVCDQVVETLDIYPTLADLCGLPRPAHLEGKSLRPLLEHPAENGDTTRYAYAIWPQNRWVYDKTVMGYSVKDDRFNYVEWVQLSTGEVLERELYDHDNDPQETVNVVDEESYAAAVDRLGERARNRQLATDHDHGFKKLR